jgi:hypothetical protein
MPGAFFSFFSACATASFLVAQPVNNVVVRAKPKPVLASSDNDFFIFYSDWLSQEKYPGHKIHKKSGAFATKKRAARMDRPQGSPANSFAYARREFE